MELVSDLHGVLEFFSGGGLCFCWASGVDAAFVRVHLDITSSDGWWGVRAVEMGSLKMCNGKPR